MLSMFVLIIIKVQPMFTYIRASDKRGQKQYVVCTNTISNSSSCWLAMRVQPQCARLSLWPLGDITFVRCPLPAEVRKIPFLLLLYC